MMTSDEIVHAYMPEQFPVFMTPPQSVLDTTIRTMERYMSKIDNYININKADIETTQSSLNHIAERVEMRRVYFHIFHNGMKMGELNEGALLCFWILKLAPFRYPNIENHIINARIALTIFINMAYFYANSHGKHLNFDKDIRDHLFYAFRFRDLSKEAIMHLAETIIV